MNHVKLLAGGACGLVLAGCAAAPATEPTTSAPRRTLASAPASPPTAPTTASGTTTPAPRAPAPGRTAPAPRPTSSPAVPPLLALTACSTRQLVLSEPRVEGTAGSWYATYLLGNTGPGTCGLTGYPGFALLFADGTVIQHPASRTGAPFRTVAIHPGGHAQFVVRTVDATIPGTGCSPSWRTAFVQVYPPGETTPIRHPSHLPACDLTVGPVTAS